jgi:hypothetical protein
LPEVDQQVCEPIIREIISLSLTCYTFYIKVGSETVFAMVAPPPLDRPQRSQLLDDLIMGVSIRFLHG